MPQVPIIDIHAHNMSGVDIPISGFATSRYHVPKFLGRLLERVYARSCEPASEDTPRYFGPDDDPFSDEALEALVMEVAAEDTEIQEGIDALMEKESATNRDPESFGLGDALKIPALVTAFARWGVLLSRPRDEITERMFAESPQVDVFTPLMVDMEFWVDSAPAVSVYEQVEQISPLIARYSGRLLPFVSFCPRREIKYGGGDKSALDLVKHAIERRGFVGVKVYPPMGFTAFGNQDEAGRLDVVLRRLFDYCLKEDIPITAHGSALGAEARKGLGKNSAPVYWKALGEFDACYKKLRLNLAHFAGVHADKDYEGYDCYDGENPEEDWRDALTEMLAEWPLLYTDTGYHRLFDTPTRRDRDTRKVRRRYFKHLDKRLKRQEVLRERLMLGSDWHMTVASEDTAAFMSAYQAEMQDRYDEKYPGFIDDFMGGNALRFLGMQPGLKPYKRLRAFLVAHGRPLPWWLHAAPPDEP